MHFKISIPCMHRCEAPVRCTSSIKTLSVDPSMTTQTDSVTTEGVNSLVKLIVSCSNTAAVHSAFLSSIASSMYNRNFVHPHAVCIAIYTSPSLHVACSLLVVSLTCMQFVTVGISA